ncbi:MAG: SCO family protein [Gammaproteobacteria bacterium]|nr:SCO family protein [Gammaproteobacteria bacterium]
MNRTANSAVDVDARDGRRSRVRLELIFLVLIFVLPIVAAFVVFFLWQPTSFVHHGNLVEPVRPIQNVPLRTLDGREFQFAALQPRWNLIYFVDGHCTDPCHNALFKINQVRLAQGKNVSRVNSVAIFANDAAQHAAAGIVERYPGILALMGAPDSIRALASQFASQHQLADRMGYRLYVVDPLGNLIMSYPENADPTGIKKDLKRLLKASQVG